MRDEARRLWRRQAGEAAEDEALGRRIGEAGERPPLDEDDVAALAAAARQILRERARAAPAAEPRRTPDRRLWLPLAAALAVALGVAVWWALARGGVASPVLARVEAARGAVSIVESPDGAVPVAAGVAVERGALLCTGGEASRAVLRMAGGAELRLPGESCVRLAAGDRVALERGALLADTGEAAGVGLTVDTPFGTVVDVGTRFAVRLLDEGVDVEVEEGIVLVAGTHHATAGEGLVLRGDGRVERRRLRTEGVAEWADEHAILSIEGRSLADFLEWAARESGWRLRYADPTLAAEAEEIVLHGDLGELRPHEAPFVVVRGAGLEARLEEETLVVSRQRGAVTGER